MMDESSSHQVWAAICNIALKLLSSNLRVCQDETLCITENVFSIKLVSITSELESILNCIEKEISSGGKVAIHCRMGRGRTGTLLGKL